MSDDSHSPSVLVVSGDNDLLDQLTSSNTNNQKFKGRDSIQKSIEDADLLSGNSIVIVDTSINGDDTSATIDHILKLKRHDPTQVLILVGEADQLASILKTGIQPLVYRAFNKPVNANQISLAFTNAHKVHADLIERLAGGEDLSVVGPGDNRTDVDALAAQKNNMSLVYMGIAVVAVGIFAWLLLGDSSNQATVTIETAPQPTLEATESKSDTPVLESTNTVTALNDKAKLAFSEGRLVSPAGDNALELYQQALSLDPYDSVAYEGKQSIADALRASYLKLVEQADFDKALRVIKSLQRIEPLNLENDALHAELETSINKHVAKVQSQGTAEEIAKTSAILNKMEKSFAGSQTAAAALKKEQELIALIDEAIGAGNLIPPQKGNAYALVSTALKKNTISKANSRPRVVNLGGKLIKLARDQLKEANLQESEKLAALVKRLGGNPKGLASLNKAINKKKASVEKALAEERTKREELAKAAAEEPAAPIITPAKAISQTPPRYPKRALDRNITGWVEMSFIVATNGEPYDIKVVKSEPVKTFDDAALRAVKKWRFQPARNETTGLAVESTIDSTKLNFQIAE